MRPNKSGEYVDFDSAIPRFESWRPSQPVRYLRCDFPLCGKRRHFRWLGEGPGSPHDFLNAPFFEGRISALDIHKVDRHPLPSVVRRF
jgi:hypothetical protein